MNDGILHGLRGVTKSIFLIVGSALLLPGIYLLLDGANLRAIDFSRSNKGYLLDSLLSSASLIVVGSAFLVASMLLIFHALNDSRFSRIELRIMRIAFSFVSIVSILLLVLAGAEFLSSQRAEDATARGLGIAVTAILVAGGLALLISMACIVRALFVNKGQV
jgi:hypothetical protein